MHLIFSEKTVLYPKTLSGAERLARAASFYSAAVPLFLKYKILQYSIKFKRETLGENITELEEEDMRNALHDWGSDLITEKIKELKGFIRFFSLYHTRLL